MRSWLCIAVWCVLLLGASPAGARENLNIELVSDHINITTGFNGSTLSVFGTKWARGDVVIVLEGPLKESVVRRKARIMGAWINSEWLNFENIPAYYDYALSRPMDKNFLPAQILRENRIGLNALKTPPEDARYDAKTIAAFQEALVRTKQKQNLFAQNAGDIHFIDDNFFRVDFKLPDNVPRGEYTIRAALVRDGQIVHEVQKDMRVAQVGFSAKVYKAAHDHAILYGFLCVLLSLFTGWASHILVHRH
jgi:uncharacterized protein (TIGR02186 family)